MAYESRRPEFDAQYLLKREGQRLFLSLYTQFFDIACLSSSIHVLDHEEHSSMADEVTIIESSDSHDMILNKQGL